MTDAGGSDQKAPRPHADMFAPSPLIAAFGLFLLPLTWWAPIGIVAPMAAIGFVLLLLRFWFAQSAPAAARLTAANATLWLLSAGATLAAASFILDAGASLRIAIAALVVTRTLLLFPAARTSLIWLAGAHVAASLLSGIALGAGLCVVLISIAALLRDLAGWSRTGVAQSGLAPAEAQQPHLPDAPDTDQPARAAGDADASTDTEIAGAVREAEGGSETAGAPRQRPDSFDILRGTAALAGAFIAGLFLIVQTPSAPLATRPVAPQSDAPSEAEIDAEWRARFPWAFPALPGAQTADLIPGECARSDYYDRIELHVLLEPQREDAGGWTNVAAQFEHPAIEAAAAEAANAAFGAPCSNDARVRLIDSARLSVADNSGFTIGKTAVVGTVYQLATPRGPLLLARAWSQESGIVLLLAGGADADAQIIAISNRSAWDRGGRLFTVEGADGQLWYGALSEDAYSASAVDIIDVSGDAPQNTGSIIAWGASTCGQTLGDPLYPAEENCVEDPAWAYWLVKARYSSEAHDRIDLIWNVRRQSGQAGEPATYEEPSDELMHGIYERQAGGWRLTRLAGPELNGLQAQLTQIGPDNVVQQ